MGSKIEWVTVSVAPEYEVNRMGIVRRNCEGHTAKKGRVLTPTPCAKLVKYCMINDGDKKNKYISTIYRDAFGIEFDHSKDWLSRARCLAEKHYKSGRIKGRPKRKQLEWKWMDFDPWLTFELYGANEQDATASQLHPMDTQMVPVW